jgi:glucosamine kinase
MTSALSSLVVAVDGGGTRCRVAAYRGGKIECVETGPANVSTDFYGSVLQITQGLERLAAQLGLLVETLQEAPAFVGLAGVVGPEIAARVRGALPFEYARVADDRAAAVRGALGPRDGVIAHCGTGSFFAAQGAGTFRFAGGWGPILGDEASAQWVGRAALHLALRIVDGFRPTSPLAERLLSDFGGAAGIVRFAGKATPSAFGALAPLVTEHAKRGDALAGEIMRDGAAEVSCGLRLVGWRPGLAVCLTGGIGPYYADYLPKDLRDCVIERAGRPLEGAISLAQEFAQDAVLSDNPR